MSDPGVRSGLLLLFGCCSVPFLLGFVFGWVVSRRVERLGRWWFVPGFVQTFAAVLAARWRQALEEIEEDV
jgi:hypothetical protein